MQKRWPRLASTLYRKRQRSRCECHVRDDRKILLILFWNAAAHLIPKYQRRLMRSLGIGIDLLRGTPNPQSFRAKGECRGH